MRRWMGRIWLGGSLIVAASVFLLLSDWHERQIKRRVPRVAILQIGSHALLDEAVDGILAGLRGKGFENGRSVQVQRFNAQDDMATANSIARLIVDSRFDLAVTVTTPCLQAMASANREGKVRHVFGVVTDPFGAGVGLTRGKPLDHPAHLAGIGTFEPVKDTFHLARKLYPGLRRAGTMWNPAEACSVACAQVAEETARQLGVELIQAHVENTTAVLQGVDSVIARGAEVIFTGCDNTVESAVDAVLKSARQARIPVLSYAPGHVDKGALAGLGADYYEVGRATGELAGEVLNGRAISSIPVEDVLPKKLAVNETALANLRIAWRLPPDVVETAVLGIDGQGRHWKRAARGGPAVFQSAAIK